MEILHLVVALRKSQVTAPEVMTRNVLSRYKNCKMPTLLIFVPGHEKTCFLHMGKTKAQAFGFAT